MNKRQLKQQKRDEAFEKNRALRVVSAAVRADKMVSSVVAAAKKAGNIVVAQAKATASVFHDRNHVYRGYKGSVSIQEKDTGLIHTVVRFAPVTQSHRIHSRYMPHQGKQECARRRYLH